MGTNHGTQIRRVRTGEWEKLRRVRLAALSESPEAFGSEFATESARPEVFWLERTATASGSPESATWIAEGPEERWIGIAGLHSAEGTFHLTSVWVDPAHRRRGIARRLVVALLDRADRIGPERGVHLDVNPRLVAAVELYRSVGFVETGESGPLRPGSEERRIAMVRPPR
jgi:ribosomal protein S18 acetylase RimI-like enzyme